MIRHFFFVLLFFFPVLLSADGNKTGFSFPGNVTSFLSFDIQAVRKLPYAGVFAFDKKMDKQIADSPCPASRTALLYMKSGEPSVMQLCPVTSEKFRQMFKDTLLPEKKGILMAKKDDYTVSLISSGCLLFADEEKTEAILASRKERSPVEPYLAELPDDCVIYAVLDVPDELRGEQDWKYVSKIAFSLKRESCGPLPNRMRILLFPNALPDAAAKVHASLTNLVNQAYSDAEKKGTVTAIMRLWYRVVPCQDHSALLVALEDAEAKAFLSMIFENMSDLL